MLQSPTKKRILFSQEILPNNSLILVKNRPFPSSCLPPLESESKCEVFLMKISFHSYPLTLGLDSSRDNDILRDNTTLFKFKNMFRQKLLPSSV